MSWLFFIRYEWMIVNVHMAPGFCGGSAFVDDVMSVNVVEP